MKLTYGDLLPKLLEKARGRGVGDWDDQLKALAAVMSQSPVNKPSGFNVARQAPRINPLKAIGDGELILELISRGYAVSMPPVGE